MGMLIKYNNRNILPIQNFCSTFFTLCDKLIHH